MSAPTEVRCDGCDVLADPAIGLTLIGYKHWCGGTWRHSPAPLSPVHAHQLGLFEGARD